HDRSLARADHADHTEVARRSAGGGAGTFRPVPVDCGRRGCAGRARRLYRFGDRSHESPRRERARVSFDIVNPDPPGRPRGWNNGMLAAAGGRVLFVAGTTATAAGE